MPLDCAVGQDGAGIVVPVADFADVEAKVSWEREYSDVLRCYYTAVAAVAIGACARGSEYRVDRAGVIESARSIVGEAVGKFGFADSTRSFATALGNKNGGRCVSFSRLACDGANDAGGTVAVDAQGGTLGHALAVTGGSYQSCDHGVFGGRGYGDGVCRDGGSVEKVDVVSGASGTCFPAKGGEVDSGVVVGEKTLRNRERRREHKERKERKKKLQAAGERSRYVSGSGSVPEWRRKQCDVGGARLNAENVSVKGRGFFSGVSEVVREKLCSTRAERLTAENELAVFKARRQMELEKAKDIDQLKKRQETQIMRQTEVNKVQVEKAFASLARAGNVPGVPGSVETVVSGSGSGSSPVFSGIGSGSVSPNSSVSLAEIHALQKDSLSKQKDIEEMQRQLNHLKFLDPDMYKKIGGGFVRAPTVDTGYTVDSKGQPVGEPPDSHWGGEVRADGKYHYITDEPFHLYEY